MIQISNGAGRLAVVDVGADGRVILELEATSETANPEMNRNAESPPAAGAVLGMYLESREAALLAVAILNAHLGGEAWRNLQLAFPRVITPEVARKSERGRVLPWPR